MSEQPVMVNATDVTTSIGVGTVSVAGQEPKVVLQVDSANGTFRFFLSPSDALMIASMFTETAAQASALLPE